ncbi:MAG: GntR family transcriptional regulator [Erysipelotrichaceae bacterium]
MALPVYKKLIDSIKHDTANMEPNTPISSERELAEHYDVSRMTARKAVDELVKSGILYREKNRGTFVAEHSLHKEFDHNWIYNAIATTSSYKVLYFDVKQANEEISKLLHIPIDDAYLRLVKLNMDMDKSLSLDELYVDRRIAKSQALDQLEGLLDINNKSEDMVVKQKFYPVIVPVKYAALLKVRIGSCVQLVESELRTKNGLLCCVIRSFINQNHVSIEVTL